MLNKIGVLFIIFFLSSCGNKEDSVLSSPPILFDQFSTVDTSVWLVSDGYSNNGVFNCEWESSHSQTDGNELSLLLNNTPGGSKAYSSGEMRTNALHHYGRYEVRMKPAKQDGIVSAFFTYTGTPHDEIDIEFLGKDTSKMQVNFFKNGVGGNEVLINLGFDASLAYHTYAFEWRENSITWFVDGVQVHAVNGTSATLPSTPGYIYINLWNGIGVDAWLNPFVYSVPLRAYYDYVKLTE